MNGTIVELGSFVGTGSSLEFGKAIRKRELKATLYCVDIFDDNYYAKYPDVMKRVRMLHGQDRIIDIFERNMRAYPHETIVGDSADAAKGFPDGSVDLVFVDADHSYDGVQRDVSAWWPKVKFKGQMLGHDYGRKEYGVTEAVHEIFGTVENPARSIWRVAKC